MEDIQQEIIVIGNGSSVLNHQYGELIDSFPDVVRFNDFKTEGYEKFIGSKTTIWARSNSKRTKERDWGIFDSVLVASPEWNYGNINRIVKGKDNATVISQEQALALQQELKLPGRVVKRGLAEKRGWPSTGLLILNYLIDKFETVYIHGFDCFKKEEGFSRHYYNNKERMSITHVHREDKEKEWIDKNIESGKLKTLHNE
jgi:hypothetical protein